MSWRDDTPQPVQDDLDLLADRALSAAQHLLEKNGEFYPFGVNLASDGAPTMVAAEPGEGEYPSSQTVLDMLHSGAAAQRDAIRAAAFVAPVETANGDAVCVEIEHRDGGPSLELLLPYQRKRLRKTFEFGQLAAGVGERHVWS
jgi:hypothetical protein